LTTPPTSLRNFTPTSTAAVSESAATPGVAVSGQIVHGQVAGPGLPTVTVTPAPGASRLPLSSAARLLMVTDPEPLGVQE
jgi:hypothetical protein